MSGTSHLNFGDKDCGPCVSVVCEHRRGFIAIDSNGTLISNGSDFSLVVQNAINWVYANGGGKIFVKRASISQSNTIIIKPCIELIFESGTVVFPSNDVDLYIVQNRGKLFGGIIDCRRIAYTHSAVVIDGSDKPTRGTEINIELLGGATGKGFYLKSLAADGYIWGISISSRVTGFEYGCHLSRSGDYAKNWINGNTFDLLVDGSVHCFYMEHDGPPISDLDGNTITLQIQARGQTIDGLVIGGRYNRCICMIWDWYLVGNDRGVYCQSGSSQNYIDARLSDNSISDNGSSNIWICPLQNYMKGLTIR